MSKAGPISRASIDFVLGRSISIFALVLYCLSLPAVLAQIPLHNLWWDLVFMAGIPAAILWTMLVRKSLVWLRIAAGVAATLMISSYLLLFMGLLGDGSQSASRPWSWGVAGVGIALAAIASSVGAAAVYGTGFCVLIVLVPLAAAGNTQVGTGAVQDALLTAALAVVIIAPITALRRAASASDRASIAAVSSFAAAARAEAIRVERSRLDALTHDTVMATLIVAGQARSPEVVDAAQKAAVDALSNLATLAGEPNVDSAVVGEDELVSRLRAATARYGPSISSHPSLAEPETQWAIPLGAARALIQAATEAVRNSFLHAPAAPAQLTIACRPGSAAAGPEVAIDITDRGPGFDTGALPQERLGVRVSIIQRMREAGGEARITSSPAGGTHVRLTWRMPADHG
ncbi:sensor histidine kinase [Arthrobacter sp. SAFR-014]|uniref:sensor histidine kinase n=1 Tax=unclassified Arthrobacter TaxID=235627 RepID=UPI003F7B8217